MRYRVVFHVRKQPHGRLSEVKIEVDKDISSIVRNGLWVTEDYDQASDDVHSAYFLPPHKIEFIERIEDQAA